MRVEPLPTPSAPSPPPGPAAPASEAAERDRDIAGLLAAGETEAAFALLARRYAPKVHRLCLALLREPARAEDAAQDCLLRAWRALGGWRPAAGALSTWLYAITRNRRLTLLGRPALPTVSLSDEAVATEALAVAAPGTGPAAGDDGAALLRRLVGELPEAPRLALTLYYHEGRSVAEAAAMLGLPEATVKTHLHRGRARLRERLAALGLADPALWL